MAEPISSIEWQTLDLPPSCIEFCPAHPDYFCVGTYNLEKDEARAQGNTSRPQNRNGSILVFKVDDKKAQLVETVVQPSALLDLHFQPTKERQDVFAVASSTATLSIYRFSPANIGKTSAVEHLSTVRIDDIDDDVLFLSLAWHPTIPDLLAVTTSTCQVYVIGLDSSLQCQFVTESPVLTHDLEAWTVVFSPDVVQSDDGKQTTVTIYSGGDDSALRFTSCLLDKSWQSSSEGDGPLQTQYNACKLTGHEAGVTAILPTTVKMADGGRVVVTGSYDDNIRVFSIVDPSETYGMRRAKSLAELNLGGGVWRLKLISQHSDADNGSWALRVLASCMHAGARVVDIKGDATGSCEIFVISRFEEHKSMNYGSDFQLKKPLLCVSTSFYDKLLCTWEADNEEL